MGHVAKLIGLAVGAFDWAFEFAGDVVLPAIFAGVLAGAGGLIVGVALQALLHAVGVAPSPNSTYRARSKVIRRVRGPQTPGKTPQPLGALGCGALPALASC
jgi:hypothetical protein